MNNLQVEVKVESVIYGQWEKVIVKPTSGKRFNAIFRINGEVDFVDYQVDAMGDWIHEYCRKQVVEKSTFGAENREVHRIYYFANMFREAMKKFAVAYPKACNPVERDYAFTFRFLLTSENDHREQNGGECWTLQAIEFFPASRRKATKPECVVEYKKAV